MAAPTLIYCAGKNKRFDEIAQAVGFRLGLRLPHKVDFPPYFADQDWRAPNRPAYMAELAKYRPTMATVLDLERDEQLAEVLDWAEEAAQYAQQVLIIPKVFSIIPRLPWRVGGADVVLAYSVPTKFSGTQVPAWEFDGRPIHLLGGSPQAQMRLAHYLKVVSADGNMANRMATDRCQYWVNGTATGGHDRYWPQLKGWNEDAPYEAFRRSCENIMMAWNAQN